MAAWVAGRAPTRLLGFGEVYRSARLRGNRAWHPRIKAPGNVLQLSAGARPGRGRRPT